MWVTILLGIINFALSGTGTWLLGLSGFDLTPIGMVMIARSGENIIVGAIVLTATYMLPRPGRFAFFIVQAPVAVLIGYLALATSGVFLGIIVFHAISVTLGLLLGMFSGRYIMYTIVNLGLNISVARVYGWFSS